MGAQNSLRIGAVVDTTALNNGFDESSAATKAFVENLNVSFANGRAASQRAFGAISEDVKIASQNVSAAGAKMASATREASAAHQDLRRAMVLVKDSSVDAATSTNLLAAAQERARIAAKELKAAEEGVAGASTHVVSQEAAASAAARSLEGNPGIRATERFLSTTLGLGGAMTALFPIIGGVGLAKMVFDLGDNFYQMEQKASHAVEKTKEGFEELHEKARVNIDDLTVQADKIQDNINKLQGHPGNGLQTALDEARQMADKLLESLRNDRKELEALLKEHSMGGFESFMSGIAGTGQQQKEMLKDQVGLHNDVAKADSTYQSAYANAKTPEAIQKASDERNAAVRAAFQREIDVYKAEVQRLADEERQSEERAAASAASGNDGANALIVNNSQKSANIQGRIQQLQDMEALETAQQRLNSLQKQQGQAKQDKVDEKSGDTAARQAAEAQRKADEGRLRALEAHATQEKNIFNASAAEEQRYWQSKLSLFQEGSTQYDAVLRHIEAADQHAQEQSKKRAEAQEKDAVEATKAVIAATAGSSAFLKQIDEDLTRTGERWQSYWKDQAKGAEIAASVAQNISMAQLRALQASGGISALGAAQVEAALHAEEHRLKIKALEEELERLQAMADKSPKGPTGENLVDPKVAAQIAQVKNSIAAESGAGKVQAIGDQSSVAQQIAQPWLTASTMIETGFVNMQRQVLTGQKSFTQSMLQLSSQLALNALQNIEKVLFAEIKKEIMITATHAAQKAAQTTVNATSAAADIAISKTSNATQGLDAAKLVFKNVYAQVSGWPFVGPVLAPILAGGAFAAVAAFEQGTMQVPREGMAVLHPGEAVLTNPNPQIKRDALSGKLGGGGGDMNVNFNGNHTFNGKQAGDSGLADHEQQLVRTLKKLHRDGRLKFARPN